MDEDFALALRLQLEEDEQLKEIRKESSGRLVCDVIKKTGLNGLSRSSGLMSNSLNSKPLSIVDEEWELIDPVPNIIDLFLQFNQEYFDGLLAGVEVKWSSRMTLCAGLCSYERRGGFCSIRLSQPLLKLRPRKDLIQTLLHEMIHAVLFVTHNNKDHDSHGPEFLKHMQRINKQTGTNITVYHNFHDEVNNYRQHWWRCDGPCQKRPPYYGIARRAMNRAPSKNDTWWAVHMRTCGGKYTKIKEPEDYGKKNSKRKREQNSDSNKEKETENLDGSTKKSIGFPGKGKAIGGSDNGTISKWFKPVEEVKDVNPKHRSPLKNISKAVVDEKQMDKLKGSSSVSSHVGNVLGDDKAGLANGRAAWIDRLMKKQEEAIERRNKLINGLKVKGNKKVESIGSKIKGQTDISSAFAKTNTKDQSCTVTPKTNVLHLEDDDDGDFRFGRKGSNNGIAIASSIKGKLSSTTEMSIPNRPSSVLSSSPMASKSSSSSPSRSSASSSSSTSSSSSSVIPSSSLSSSSSSRSFTSSSLSSSTPSSSLSSSASRSSASSSSLIPSSPLSSLTSSSSSTSRSEPPCRGFQIISSSISETPSVDSMRGMNNNKSNINRFPDRRPIQIVLDDSFTSNGEHEELVSCPVCPKKISIHSINLHLDECLSRAS